MLDLIGVTYVVCSIRFHVADVGTVVAMQQGGIPALLPLTYVLGSAIWDKTRLVCDTSGRHPTTRGQDKLADQFRA